MRIPQDESSQGRTFNNGAHDLVENAEGVFHPQNEDTMATAFFTPERIAEIRDAAVEARIGNNINIDQYRELRYSVAFFSATVVVPSSQNHLEL